MGGSTHMCYPVHCVVCADVMDASSLCSEWKHQCFFRPFCAACTCGSQPLSGWGVTVHMPVFFSTVYIAIQLGPASRQAGVGRIAHSTVLLLHAVKKQSQGSCRRRVLHAAGLGHFYASSEVVSFSLRKAGGTSHAPYPVSWQQKGPCVLLLPLPVWAPMVQLLLLGGTASASSPSHAAASPGVRCLCGAEASRGSVVAVGGRYGQVGVGLVTWQAQQCRNHHTCTVG